MAVIIEADTYYKNLFFATTIIAIKSIKLIANNARYTLITSISVCLVTLEIDYS